MKTSAELKEKLLNLLAHATARASAEAWYEVDQCCKQARQLTSRINEAQRTEWIENYNRTTDHNLKKVKAGATKVYAFVDGQFQFYTAFYGKWPSYKKVTFRVRLDRTPEERAIEKNITGYDVIFTACLGEIQDWFRRNPKHGPVPCYP
jgi:hypothetical protein